MPFKKGQSGNPKGSKPGSGVGRKPDWLKEKCRKIIGDAKLVEFLGKVAGGANTEQVVTDQGETLSVPAPIKDRLRAVEMLLDRGYGKASQPIEHSGDSGSRLIFVHPSQEGTI